MEEKDNELIEVNTKSEEEVSSELEKRFQDFLEAKQDLEKIENNAAKTQERIEKAKETKAGIFNKGKKIDEVENILCDVATNQADMSKINRKMLELQQKQSQALKFALMLGLSNLASNRATVRFLKEKLENKNGVKLSSTEKEEILSTIKQLKEQEDIFNKQDNLTTKVKENAKKTEELEKELLKVNNDEAKRNNAYVITLSIIAILLGLSGLIISIIVLIK